MQTAIPRLYSSYKEKSKMKKMKTFNLIITGYGGQGVLTLTEIITKAALKQGYEAKEAELHGLAQRGGSLDCHVRFGKDVQSPLVMRGKADLIISLEALEALRACYWANKKTIILTNSKVFRCSTKLKSILNRIKKVSKSVYSIDADKIVRETTKDTMMVNIFMLGYAIKKGFLPLKKEIVWQSLEERIRKRFLEQNKKVFEAAFKIK